jgi:copper chaperone CopZ
VALAGSRVKGPAAAGRVAPVTTVVFEVEQAGCGSCATRVRSALEPLGAVDEVQVDEQADCATVSLVLEAAAGEPEVAAALRAASDGSGHEYRVKPGSWRVGG